MKVSLKGLPNTLSGGAWPSSARAVKCPVKSGNERDPRHYLQPVLLGGLGTIMRLPRATGRKVWATVGPYAPNPLGYTRDSMVGTMGCNSERRSQSPKSNLSLNRGLELTLVKAKSLVIASHKVAMNVSMFLAHTARQTTRVGRG